MYEKAFETGATFYKDKIMKKFNDINSIEQYLLGELDNKESKVFEKKMERNLAFREEVMAYQNLLIGIQLAGEQIDQKVNVVPLLKETNLSKSPPVEILKNGQLKSKIKSIESQLSKEGFFESPKPKALFRKRFLAVAASIAAIFTIGFFYLFQVPIMQADADAYVKNIAQHKLIDKLYAKHFEIDKQQLNNHLATLRISGFADKNKVRKENLRKALVTYKNCVHAKCRFNSFGAHLKKYPNSETAVFYKALAAMELELYPTAISLLTPLATSSTERQEAAIWYQGLCYLKIPNKNEKGVSLLKQVSTDSTSFHAKKAQSILNELNF